MDEAHRTTRPQRGRADIRLLKPGDPPPERQGAALLRTARRTRRDRSHRARCSLRCPRTRPGSAHRPAPRARPGAHRERHSRPNARHHPARRRACRVDVTGRKRTLQGDDLARLRLGYAQHIHRAQGATVTRTLVVTGGWQTSKEPAYVEASRARQGTNWFVARAGLGLEGQDGDRIGRLAEQMRRSHVQTPSLTRLFWESATHKSLDESIVKPLGELRLPGPLP